MEIRPPRPAHHLVELLDGEPLNAHRKRIEDHLGRREIDACGKRRRGHDSRDLPVREPPLHVPAFLGGQPRVIGGGLGSKGVGNDMTAGPGVREDDRLAPVALRRPYFVFLGGHLLDEPDLLVSLDEDEVAFERNRPVRVADKVCPEFLREQSRSPDRGREVEELRLGRDVLEPGDQPVETVAAFRILEHLHLVDDDGADVFYGSPGPESVVDPLVSPHHHGSVDVPVARRTGLGEVETAHPGLQGDPDQVTVAVAEPLVLLVRERDQRNQEERPPPAFEEILHPGHLPDEGLAARGRRDDQEVLPLEEAVLNGELLDGHQVLDPGCLCKRGRERKIGDMGGFLNLVRLEPVKERSLPVGVIGPHRRQHPVEVPDLGEEFLKMNKHRAAELPQVTELAAHLALCALHADPLPAVPDAGRLVDRREPVLELAEPADVDPR
ncbi:hypothetical protein DSECCO2_654080 [anaerobic digester metagenome]